MAFWSGETLQHRGQQVVAPFNPKQIDCNSYTLRMGGEFYSTGNQENSGSPRRVQLGPRESRLISPGQYAFLLSKEDVCIPNDTMAFISMRTGIKFQGLINISGFHVDPGYEGKLAFAVYNASPSPIQISEDDKLFKIWFCDMDRTSAQPFVKGPGDGLTEISSEMIRGLNKEILSLQGLSEKLREHEENLDRRFSEQKPVIDNLTFVWRAIVLGVIVAIILSLLKFPKLSDAEQALRELISGSPANQTEAPRPPPKQPGAATSPDGSTQQ